MGEQVAPLGRVQDVARVRAALQDGGLVVLTGLGGVGKTTVARAVAGEDAVLVPLEPLPDGAPVEVLAEAALAAGGTPEAAAEGGAVAGLLRVLRARPRLLVLDNAEHVRASAAELCERVAGTGCPVLVSSRVPLGLAAEHVVELPGLQVDGAALELLRRRLHGDVGDPGAAEQVCRLLDGHPLALELAAASARVHGLPGVLERLREGRLQLRLASRGSRHADLGEVVRSTLALLDPGDVDVLRDVAVFADGAPWEALVRVGGLADEVLHPHVLRLLDAGLLRTAIDPAGAPRLHLHPVVRAVLGGADAARQSAYVAWVESAVLPLGRFDAVPRPGELQRALEPDVRAAVGLLDEDPERAARLLLTSLGSSETSDRAAPLARLLRPLLPALPPRGQLLGQAQLMVASALELTGDPDVGALFEGALASARRAGDPAGQVYALINLAEAARARGEPEVRDALYAEAQRLLPEVPVTGSVESLDRGYLRVCCVVGAAWTAQREGRYRDGADLVEAESEHAHTPLVRLLLQTNAGMLALDGGEVERARALLRDAVRGAQARGARATAARWLLRLGWLEVGRPGRETAAHEALREAEDALHALGLQVPLRGCRCARACLAVQEGRAAEAVEDLRDLLGEEDDPQHAAKERLLLGRALRVLGDPASRAEARTQLRRVQEEPTTPPVLQASALGELALLAAEEDDAVAAAALARQAQALPWHGDPDSRVVAEVTRAQWQALVPAEQPLTPRQVDALRAVADGRTTAAAARSLGISPATLNKHLENAYRALDVQGRLQALARLRELGLL